MHVIICKIQLIDSSSKNLQFQIPIQFVRFIRHVLKILYLGATEIFAMHIKSQMWIPTRDTFYDPIIYFIANCKYTARTFDLSCSKTGTRIQMGELIEAESKSISRAVRRPLTFHSAAVIEYLMNSHTGPRSRLVNMSARARERDSWFNENRSSWMMTESCSGRKIDQVFLSALNEAVQIFCGKDPPLWRDEIYF